MTFIGTPDRFFDGWKPFFRSRDLDEQIGPSSPREKILRGAYGSSSVIGEQRRDFERYISIYSAGMLVYWSQKIDNLSQIFERDLKEQFFAGLSLFEFLVNFLIVVTTPTSGIVKNGGTKVNSATDSSSM